MIGYDELRDAVIPFSIDHIKGIEILAETFEKPAGHDLKTFLQSNCFNGIHGTPITVTLKLTGINARIFAERSFHPSQKTVWRLTTKNSESLIVEMTVAEGRGLERFIQSWLPDVEVISPPALRLKIRENLRLSLEKLGE